LYQKLSNAADQSNHTIWSRASVQVSGTKADQPEKQTERETTHTVIHCTTENM